MLELPAVLHTLAIHQQRLRDGCKDVAVHDTVHDAFNLCYGPSTVPGKGCPDHHLAAAVLDSANRPLWVEFLADSASNVHSTV